MEKIKLVNGETVGIEIKSDDRVNYEMLEGKKPLIKIKEKSSRQKVFTISFEDKETFEYFILKLSRIYELKTKGKLRDYVDNARQKVLKLNQELNRTLKAVNPTSETEEDDEIW